MTAYTYEAAALLTTLDAIRAGVTAVTLDYVTSGIEPGGHPPPRSGSLYVSLDESGITNEGSPEQDHLKERISITVFVSQRTGVKAADRAGDIYLKQTRSMAPIERQIIASLHGQVGLVAAMNAYLGTSGGTIQGVQEGLWYTGRAGTAVESAVYWSSDTDDSSLAVGWLVRKMNFIGFRRVTSKYSIT